MFTFYPPRICYLTKQKGHGRCDYVKWDEEITLDHLGGPNLIMWVLKTGESCLTVVREGNVTVEEWPEKCHLDGFRDKEDHESGSLEAGNKEMDSSLEQPQGTQPCQHADISPLRSGSDG